MALAQALRNRPPQRDTTHDDKFQAAYEAGQQGIPFDEFAIQTFPDFENWPDDLKREVAHAYQFGKEEGASEVEHAGAIEEELNQENPGGWR